MRQYIAIAVLALGCSGQPFAASEAELGGSAGEANVEQPSPGAGAPAAGAGRAPVEAGTGGAGGRAGGAAGSPAGGSAGQAGEPPIVEAGSGGQGGAGGSGGSGPSSNGAAGMAGQAGTPPKVDDACDAPSQDGPLSGSRDCTADCADGTLPCAGTCDNMSAGGCSGSYTLGVAGADMSFVLDAHDAWSFVLPANICARVTAMQGAGLAVDSKAATCWTACGYEREGFAASMSKRAWLRVETAAQPLACP